MENNFFLSKIFKFKLKEVNDFTKLIWKLYYFISKDTWGDNLVILPIKKVLNGKM